MVNELPLFLSHSPLFQGAALPAVQQLAAGASVVYLQRGEHLFHVNQDASAFFLLRSGKVLLYRPDPCGYEKVHHIVEAGGLVAEAAMFARPCCYPVSARAQTPATLYRMARSSLLNLVRRSGEVAVRLLGGMSSSMHQAINRIDLLTVGNVSQRLVLYLADLSRHQQSRLVHLPLPSGVLARQLGIAPETLSRQLAYFRRCALVDGHNRDWILLDLEGLFAEVGLELSPENQR